MALGNCVLVVLLVGLPTIAGYAPASLIARPLRRRAQSPVAVDPNVAFDALDLVLLSPVAVPVLGAAALGKASAAAKDESEAKALQNKLRKSDRDLATAQKKLSKLTDSVQQTQAMLKAQNRGFKEQTAGLGKTVEEARRREAAAAQEARELERAVAQKKSALRRAGAAPPKARSRSTAGKQTTVPADANPADWVAATGAVLAESLGTVPANGKRNGKSKPFFKPSKPKASSSFFGKGSKKKKKSEPNALDYLAATSIVAFETALPPDPKAKAAARRTKPPPKSRVSSRTLRSRKVADDAGPLYWATAVGLTLVETAGEAAATAVEEGYKAGSKGGGGGGTAAKAKAKREQDARNRARAAEKAAAEAAAAEAAAEAAAAADRARRQAPRFSLGNGNGSPAAAPAKPPPPAASAAAANPLAGIREEDQKAVAEAATTVWAAGAVLLDGAAKAAAKAAEEVVP